MASTLTREPHMNILTIEYKPSVYRQEYIEMRLNSAYLEAHSNTLVGHLKVWLSIRTLKRQMPDLIVSDLRKRSKTKRRKKCT